MASLETRKTPTGMTFRIKWRQDGAWQSETFGPGRKNAALRFKRDVELNDNCWPEGWLRGHGYVAQLVEETGEKETPFRSYATQFVADKTGLTPGTKCRYARQVVVLADELDIIVAADQETGAEIATMENLTTRHIARWVNARELAGVAPKTISNWHGLLFQLLQAAVEEELRAKNPCIATGRSLPRRDGVRTTRRLLILTEPEFALIATAMWPGLPDPALEGAVLTVGTEADRGLLIAAIGTGARWGELTALQVADLHLDAVPPYVDVQRAWKRNGTGEHALDGVGRWYLGAPKTVRGRRQIRIGEATRQVLLRASADKAPDALVFTGVRGGPLDQPHFYEYRWQRAVALAQRNGLTKKPRFHDLRRSYGAWLKSANVPLPEIQARMGHESIVTTIDTYGGILERSGDLADAAVDDALAWTMSDDDRGGDEDR